MKAVRSRTQLSARNVVHDSARASSLVPVDPEDSDRHQAGDVGALASAGLRRYWRWKSRNLGGRPPVSAELRALIRRMSP
jgi:hypothetical protein